MAVVGVAQENNYSLLPEGGRGVESNLNLKEPVQNEPLSVNAPSKG